MGGHEAIIQLLLNVFSETKQDKLIEYAMKENEDNKTSLHVAALNIHEGIVKMLLNAFSEEKKEKLIEYVMKEDEGKSTALHIAVFCRREQTVNLLLNVFGKNENTKLVAYLMKKNQDNNTVICLASQSAPQRVNDKIVKLLSQKLTNAKNEIMISNLQQVTQKFKKQTADEKKKSILWYLLGDHSCCNPGKEILMKFLIIDYSIEINIV